jgi:hypothetical protein
MCEKSVRRNISLGFTEDHVSEGQHMCYIFNDDDERKRVMAKYLESGMLANEKLLYLVDVMTPEEMLSCLDDLGVDVRSKPQSIAVAEAAPAYCPSGVFNADEMLDEVKKFYLQAVRGGYTGARGTGEMSWCLVEGRADETSLLDYEARLTMLVAEYPYTACCQYDARRFDGGVIFDVLKVHPVMIVRGQLVKNPYYVEPHIFLEELRAGNRG